MSDLPQRLALQRAEEGRALHKLSVDHQGRRREVGEQGVLQFGVDRNSTFRATPRQRAVAYDDWAERLRYAIRATR